MVSERHAKSRIDLIFIKEEEMVRKVKKTKLLSDHWGSLVDIEGGNEVDPIERVVVDCDRVDETVRKGKKKEEGNEDWYWELNGETAYDKLLEFRQNHLKTIKIVARSKRWWNEDVTKQLTKVRRVSREGQGQTIGGQGGREKRLRRWRKAAEKPKRLVGEKQEKCWTTFCEKHGHKDPCEIVRYAKDPWRLMTKMRNLRDLEGTTLETDEQKDEGLVRRPGRTK